MAIKGKKKKRSRQPSRRPASAPRPVSGAGRKPPWYQTAGGRAAAGIAIGVLLIAGLVWFKTSRDDQKALERRQESLESATGDVQALLQQISPSAARMITAQPDNKDLAKDVGIWTKTFTDAQTEMTGTISEAPPEVDLANRMLFQAVLQYVAAAETYKLIPDAPENLQDELLERAGAQVTAADGSWASGVEILNSERSDVGLDPVPIRNPTTASDQPGGTTVPLGG
ncbi:MAG TPA: hypothetical protein VE174_04040 [Actinomycetota bacterium]|nr:hypothetical protein [Actinomycetota bacterium]